MRATDKQRGFTLLEIMVVIVIIGVLASLVVPNLMGNKEKADKQKAVSDIVALENALDMYKLDNHHYPTTNQGLESLVEAPTLPPLAANYNKEGYIKRLPADPWGNDYVLVILVNMVHTICFQQGPMVKWEPRTTSPTGV